MTTTLRIDDTLKRECDKVFDELGLNMTSAVTVFLRIERHGKAVLRRCRKGIVIVARDEEKKE